MSFLIALLAAIKDTRVKPPNDCKYKLKVATILRFRYSRFPIGPPSMLGVHLIGLSQLYLNIIQLLLNTSNVTNLVTTTIRAHGDNEILAHWGFTFGVV